MNSEYQTPPIQTLITGLAYAKMFKTSSQS